MSKPLIIVESPTKAKTIGKFLGKSYTIAASYGHVRDLPNGAAEVPAALKKEKWASLGINVEKDFEPLYIIPEEKKKRVDELKKLSKEATELLLATDEDREGESISWHLLEILKPKIPVKRLVFHEITKSAIDHSLQHPRSIDDSLVRAQEARRLIDRLYGYQVSNLLWKKMAPRLSAGRVQSVATRLLVERERERMRFVSAQYWDLSGLFSKVPEKESFEADLISVQGKRVATGKDFDPHTGKLLSSGAVAYLDEEHCIALREELLKETPLVANTESKPFTQRPYPPFTTSTLQQEANRKLGFSAKRTMQVAQQLYENGFITYMRTDSTNLSQEAIEGARTLISREYGKEFLPPEPRIYKTQVKNAQEAHEAIRPAGADFASFSEVQSKLGSEAIRLYELIWKRMIACQMKDAVGTRVTADIQLGQTVFRATGRTLTFPGFLRAYVEGADDPQAELADKEKFLPSLTKGETLQLKKLDALRHETQPPPRYTEGSLIKELEQRGIGRPSTWATIVDVVLSRSYAFKRGSALVPTFLAAAVTQLLERYFSNVIDYQFTAHLEEDLDRISRGEFDEKRYLQEFYKGERPGLQTLVERGYVEIDPKEVCGIPIGEVGERKIEVRIGRYGPFLTDGENRASVPDDLPPEELTLDKAIEILTNSAQAPESLGIHPGSGKPVYVKTGRFGPYVQEGDAEEGEKPKMASLLPGMSPTEVTLEVAVKLLSLPLSLGKSEEFNNEVVVSNGRYGPYIKCGSDTRSLPIDLSPLEITLTQAEELLRQPKTRGRQAAASAKPLKELGEDPGSKKALVIKSGRYGPYVTDGEVNASLPKGMAPEEYTLDQAISLLAERRVQLESAPPKKKRASTTKATKKTAPKEEKKSTVKKKTTAPASRAKKTKTAA